MPKNSRNKKHAGGASSSSSSSSSIPTPSQVSQDHIHEKNELLKKFEENIRSMKEEFQSQKDDVNAIVFLSAMISATIHAVPFVLRIPTMIPSSRVTTRISTIETQTSQVFEEMSKIISNAVKGMKPGAKGSKKVEIGKSSCREKVEVLEKIIKEEDYMDELSLEMLDVIVITLMPELGQIRETPTCSCCKTSWQHKDKVLENTSRKLQALQEEVERRLKIAVMGAMVKS